MQYEYLLSVAERIIDSSAPADIIIKYYELKKTLFSKSVVGKIKCK